MTADFYNVWRDRALNILSQYGMDVFIKPYTADLMTFMMRKHIDKVKEASSYDTCVKMVNEAFSKQMGVRVDVTQFISSKDHRDALYMLFSAWREAVLMDDQLQINEAKNLKLL